MSFKATFISGWIAVGLLLAGLGAIPTAWAQLEVLDENQAPGRTMAQQATKERGNLDHRGSLPARDPAKGVQLRPRSDQSLSVLP